MSLAIDKQALSDVLHCKLVFICNIQFIKALSNDLVKVLIKKLFDTTTGLLRLYILVVIVEEKAADTLTLVVTKGIT